MIYVFKRGIYKIIIGERLSYPDENIIFTLSEASLFAAIRYIMNHPAEGILFPEYTDPEEIISYVSKLLPVVTTRL